MTPPRTASPQPSDATQVDSSPAETPAPRDGKIAPGGNASESSGAQRAGDTEKGFASSNASEWDADGVRVIDGVPMVGLTGPDDPNSPLNMPTAKKWLIIGIICSASFAVTCCSSMVASTYAGVEGEFNVSSEVATLGLSLFVLGLGFAPLMMSPLSEFFGRTPIYVSSYFFFICFNFLVAFSPNITAFLFGRLLSGVAGAAFLSVAGGSVADCFAPHAVGAPMGFYTASPFLGPIGGPVIAGFVNQHLNWRWTWRIFIIWAGVEFVLLVLFVPETYLPALLVKRARKLRKAGRTDVRAPLEMDQRSMARVLLVSCGRPFELLILEPMALVLCLWSSLLLGILYMFFSAFDIVYKAHGFNQQSIGLSFLGLGIGIIFGVCCHPIWARYYKRVTLETGARPPPEEHLRKGLYAAILLPASLFWFAWTTQPSIHWSVSMVATVPFGVGLIWSFQAVFVYLVDAFRPVAASAMAANSALRSSFAAGFPLFTHQMFSRLGTQWALSLCAFLLLAMSPFPFLFFKYGNKYRKGSKYSNTS